VGDLILLPANESGGDVDKTISWFMWGAFVDIQRERRRLRLQLDHDEAMTATLQKVNEAVSQLRWRGQAPLKWD
jgi:hypothetical protein